MNVLVREYPMPEEVDVWLLWAIDCYLSAMGEERSA